MSHHVFGDGGLGNLDTQFQQLAVNARCCGPQKLESSFKRPPSPGGIRDASHRAQTSSQCGNPLAACVYGRWPEPCPGWVPVVQGLM
jgi:hypothetical protein